MLERCFYCSREKVDDQFHIVTFQTANMERDEQLCDECYQEWLQGIKE